MRHIPQLLCLATLMLFLLIILQGATQYFKFEPLTDEDLTALLTEKGFKLSRRTVTKYRESMGIPVGRMRKEIKA